MIILYLEVRKTHARTRRYSTAISGMTHSTKRSGQDTSKVATQAILYSLTFIITWMPSTLWSIAHWFNWGHYGLDIAAACAEPLQGLWNFLIFLKSRPRTVVKLKKWMHNWFPCCFGPLPSQQNGGRPSDGSRFSIIGEFLKYNRSSFFGTRSDLSFRSSIDMNSSKKHNHVRTAETSGTDFKDKETEEMDGDNSKPFDLSDAATSARGIGTELFLAEMPDISESTMESQEARNISSLVDVEEDPPVPPLGDSDDDDDEEEKESDGPAIISMRDSIKEVRDSRNALSSEQVLAQIQIEMNMSDSDDDDEEDGESENENMCNTSGCANIDRDHDESDHDDEDSSESHGMMDNDHRSGESSPQNDDSNDDSGDKKMGKSKERECAPPKATQMAPMEQAMATDDQTSNHHQDDTESTSVSRPSPEPVELLARDGVCPMAQMEEAITGKSRVYVV